MYFSSGRLCAVWALEASLEYFVMYTSRCAKCQYSNNVMYFITPDVPSVKPYQLKVIMPRLHGVGRILMALVCPSVYLMPDPKSRAKVLGS